MKKMLIPIVALLAFLMFSTSVSANNGKYYMASFYGEAEGYCCAFTEAPAWPPEALGKGSVHMRGSAIVAEDTDYYWAFPEHDPNTRLWTRRTSMTVKWNNEKLTVWMWSSSTVWGYFNDTLGWFYVGNLTYFGYYKGEAGLQFIRGSAELYYGVETVPFLDVFLYTETGIWLAFAWIGDEYMGWPAARHFVSGVTVWGPIPWHPSPP